MHAHESFGPYWLCSWFKRDGVRLDTVTVRLRRCVSVTKDRAYTKTEGRERRVRLCDKLPSVLTCEKENISPCGIDLLFSCSCYICGSSIFVVVIILVRYIQIVIDQPSVEATDWIVDSHYLQRKNHSVCLSTQWGKRFATPFNSSFLAFKS